MTEMTYSFCILTHGRHAALRRLLASLESQSWSAIGADKFEILVVDNAPRMSAATIVSAYGERSQIRVRYAVENEPGISAARNRAVLEARHRFVVFIDDDQVVEPIFAEALERVWSQFSGKYSGAVLSCRHAFESKPSLPFPRLEDYPNRDYPDGTPVDLRHKRVGSGGMLLDKAKFRAPYELFPRHLGLTGGEDTHFIWKAKGEGHGFVHLNSVRVFEIVPRERATMSYLVGSHFQMGLLFHELDSLARRSEGRTAISSTTRMSVNAAKVTVSALILPLLPLLGSKLALRLVFANARSLGKILGILGQRRIRYGTLGRRATS